MRYLLAIWLAPIVLFWGWYGLSANDWNFGTIYLSRELHDFVFKVYGDTISVDPEQIPGMIAGITAVDGALVGAIVAFRYRSAWWPRGRDWMREGAIRTGLMKRDELTAATAVETEILTELQDGQARPAE